MVMPHNMDTEPDTMVQGPPPPPPEEPAESDVEGTADTAVPPPPPMEEAPEGLAAETEDAAVPPLPPPEEAPEDMAAETANGAGPPSHSPDEAQGDYGAGTSDGMAETPPRGSPPPKKKRSKAPVICLGVLAVVIALIVLLAIIAAAGLLFFGGSVQEPGYRIDKLSTQNAYPGTLLTITGSGFTEDAQDAFVRFSDGGNYRLDAPAVELSNDRIVVTVPPFLDFDSGEFASRCVSVTVIKTNVDVNTFTDSVQNFRIADMPRSLEPPGMATMAYLDGMMNLVNASKSHMAIFDALVEEDLPDQGARNALDQMLSAYKEMSAEVGCVVYGLNTSVVFGKFDGEDMSLDRATLAAIDRLVLAQVGVSAARGTVQDIAQWFVLQGENLSTLLDKTKVTTGWLADTISLADGANALTVENKALASVLKVPCTLQTISWFSGTALPGTYAFVNDLATLCASEGDLTWEKAFPIIDRFILKVGPGAVDTLTGLPLFTALGVMEKLIIGDSIVDVSGKGIKLSELNIMPQTYAPMANDGQLPTSGLDLIVNDLNSGPPPVDVDLTYRGPFSGTSPSLPQDASCAECGTIHFYFTYTVSGDITVTAKVDKDGHVLGNMMITGSWSASGEGGCPHSRAGPTSGDISESPSISGNTESFSYSGGGTMTGDTGGMNSDSVSGTLLFTTTSGGFSVPYVIHRA